MCNRRATRVLAPNFVDEMMLNHIVGYCYNDRRVIHWILKQARHGFQGIRGNFE
jgi:hypothetical protein